MGAKSRCSWINSARGFSKKRWTLDSFGRSDVAFGAPAKRGNAYSMTGLMQKLNSGDITPSFLE